MSRTRRYIVPDTSATGSSVRTKRRNVREVKRIVAKKLTAISQNAMATSPQTTAITLCGIVTAKIAVIMIFFTTSRRTINGPLHLAFNTL